MTEGRGFPHGTILLLGIVTIAAYGAWFYAFGVLLDPILADTGWPESAVAAAYSASSALGAVLAVPAGRFVDRAGARASFGSAAVIAAAGLGLASTADHVATFAAGSIAGGAALQALAFYHITQSTAVRVAPSTSTRAIALLTIYGAFSSPIYLPLAAALVTSIGWRSTMQALTASTVVVLAAAALLVRERTEDVRDRPPVTLRAGFASPAARRYTAASALVGLCVGVLLVYQVPLMTGAGLSVGVAAWMAGARGAAQITGRIPLMAIVNRIGARGSVRLSFAMITIGAAILPFAGNVAVALAYVAIAGFGIGASSPLTGIYADELFDRSALGASMGVLTMVAGLSTAIGPSIVGVLADTTGTRTWGVVLAVAAAASATAVVGSGRPARPESRPAAVGP